MWTCLFCGYTTNRLDEVDQHQAVCDDITSYVVEMKRREGVTIHYIPTETINVKSDYL